MSITDRIERDKDFILKTSEALNAFVYHTSAGDISHEELVSLVKRIHDRMMCTFMKFHNAIGSVIGRDIRCAIIDFIESMVKVDDYLKLGPKSLNLPNEQDLSYFVNISIQYMDVILEYFE
jgi:hypothetical protein